MLFSCRNPFSRGALAGLAAALLLAGCGGGGGGEAPSPLDVALQPSSSLADICTLDGQKAFLRSYLDEVYLWYNEIPSVNPADYDSITAYMNALLVRTPDTAGLPRDEFSAVLTTREADALQGSTVVAQRLRSALKDDLAPLLSGPLTGGSVPLKKVVTSSGGRKVGYVLFNDQRAGAQDALIAAFENLKASAVQDLVLDLRYNAGGYLYVAQTAASIVTSPQNAGRVFEQLRYNDKREADSRAGVLRFTSTVQTKESTYAPGYPLPQLSLPRVYVLSSDLTCSASESIVNSLRGIDVEVILVGTANTCGKPYGFRRKDNCGWAFYPIEFQGYNAKGFGDYTSGFPPTCLVSKESGNDLDGSVESLAAALSHADTGSCPPGPAVSKSDLPQSVDLGVGGRSSAASRIGGRLVLRPKDR